MAFLRNYSSSAETFFNQLIVNIGHMALIG
jgi:hypothetical protein